MTYYASDSEYELMHIIKMGFKDTYLIVYEDAFNITTGKTLIKNAQEIKELFNIDIIKDLG